MKVLWRQGGIIGATLVCALALLAYSSAAWGQAAEGPIDEDPSGIPYVAGELIVTHKPEAPASNAAAVGSRFDAEIEKTLPEIDARLLEFPEVKNERAREAREEALIRIKRSLEQNPGVESVDYNYIVEASAAPNDPQFDKQWGLKKIKAPKAWNVSKGNNMSIAVLDTGIDTDHPDLKDKIERQSNFVGTGKAEDGDGHGTHVAGIAAAKTDNGKGVAGTCHSCRLIVGKVLDDNGEGTAGGVADGIIWAAKQDAEAINLSLGSRGDADAVRKAVNYAWNKGSVVVAAAGNEDSNVKEYPAAYPKAVAVAATNAKDKRASFSNYGGWISVSAPGVSILSTLPGGYGYMSGTSMATPHVSGLAGLLAAKSQVNTAAKNRGIIESTAVDRGAAGKDAFYGWGRINAAAGVSCKRVGTMGVDNIDGTSGNDVICALAGSDTIRAFGGNDRVFAGPGDDVVRGGGGNDTLIGSAGKDRLIGNTGDDRLNGRDGVRGNDYLHGGKGRDTCSADKRDTVKNCP